jgi:hypothetical protein
LRIAWDINILIDYAEFGDLIWGLKMMKDTNSTLLSRRLVTVKNWWRWIS